MGVLSTLTTAPGPVSGAVCAKCLLDAPLKRSSTFSPLKFTAIN